MSIFPAPICEGRPGRGKAAPSIRSGDARRSAGPERCAIACAPVPSPTPTRLRSAGFTLIELMVVITIIALASAAVVLTLPDGSEKLRADAERFAGRVAAARDNAIVGARPMAVWVSPSGYGFARREQGQWRPLADKPFATTPWRDGVTADTGGQQLRVSFDGTGTTAEPVAVTLVRDGRRQAITVDGAGKVTLGA